MEISGTANHATSTYVFSSRLSFRCSTSLRLPALSQALTRPATFALSALWSRSSRSAKAIGFPIRVPGLRVFPPTSCTDRRSGGLEVGSGYSFQWVRPGPPRDDADAVAASSFTPLPWLVKPIRNQSLPSSGGARFAFPFSTVKYSRWFSTPAWLSFLRLHAVKHPGVSRRSDQRSRPAAIFGRYFGIAVSCAYGAPARRRSIRCSRQSGPPLGNQIDRIVVVLGDAVRGNEGIDGQDIDAALLDRPLDRSCDGRQDGCAVPGH